MKHFIYIIILAFTVTFVSCDSPKEKEKPKTAQSTTGTIIQFDEATVTKPRRDNTYTKAITKKTTVTEDKGAITYKSNDDAIATVDNKGLVTFVKAEGGTVTITATKAGTPKKYKSSTATYTLVIDHPDGSTIAFASKTVSQEFKAPFTYTQAVTKPRNVDDDTGAITYTSSDLLIATVDNKGLVTFKKAEGGTVTITATKAATPENKYKQSEDSYTLTITRFSPTTKQALVNEIKEAMKASGNTADLTYIDTSAITDMSSLFRSDFSPTPETEGYGLHTFNGNISTWDTSSVETMEKMFKGNTAFNQNISTWTVDSVTNMGSMFQGATSFNQAMSKWNVSNVENMRNMFQGATSFNQNIWEWAVDSVTDMRTMFHRATSFNKNIEKWDEHLRLGGRIVSKLSMFEGSALVTASTGLNYPTWCGSGSPCRRKIRE